MRRKVAPIGMDSRKTMMTSMSRRSFVGIAFAGVATTTAPRLFADEARASDPGSAAASAVPIAALEHNARIDKLQGLIRKQGIAAFLVESGSTLEYFTGVRWWRSERTTAALIPAEGKTIVVTPFFEVPSVRESLMIDVDVRHWRSEEHTSELQSLAYLVCRLLLEKKKNMQIKTQT